MNKLSSWLKEKAIARSKEERINEIISLGLGGRVVYTAGNRQFDVVGKIGSIINIKKKRGTDQYQIAVIFDVPVYKKTVAVDTQEFRNWKHKEMEDKDFYKKIKTKYGTPKQKTFRWEHWIQEEYRHVTGKEPVEQKTQDGKTLINISPLALKPATEENLASAQRTREMQPMFNQLNREITKIVRGD
jgi:hypothetical protein